MGSKERRQREREDTRRRIRDTARDLFVERGYDATTMRAIADRLEFTPTAIYHHFRNKEALLEELCVVDFGALAQAFQRIGRIEDPVERLDRIGGAYVDFALENPMQYRFMFMAQRPVQSDSTELHLGDPSASAYAFLIETCREAIELGRLAPEYDDPKEVARMLWGTVHGIASLWIAKHEVDWIEFGDVRRTAARMRAAIVRGLIHGADAREPDTTEGR